MWSDPVASEDGKSDRLFPINTNRGCSVHYSALAVNKFLDRNCLISVIRGHEVEASGYKFHKWKGDEFPPVITIFSAPNYCDIYNNKAAILKFKDNNLSV